jgi:hypothetical protein
MIVIDQPVEQADANACKTGVMPRALHAVAVDNEAMIRSEQLLIRRWQTVRALLNQQVEPVKINRLD